MVRAYESSAASPGGSTATAFAFIRGPSAHLLAPPQVNRHGHIRAPAAQFRLQQTPPALSLGRRS